MEPTSPSGSRPTPSEAPSMSRHEHRRSRRSPPAPSRSPTRRKRSRTRRHTLRRRRLPAQAQCITARDSPPFSPSLDLWRELTHAFAFYMCEYFSRPREIRLVKGVIEVCDHILSNLSHEVAHAFVSLRHCLQWILRHALTSVDWDQQSLQRAFEGALLPTQGAIINEGSWYDSTTRSRPSDTPSKGWQAGEQGGRQEGPGIAS